MFCHRCGKKLMSGARFCSWCSAAVPAELLEELEGNQPSGESVPVPEDTLKPAEVPAPEAKSAPEPEAKPKPAPIPVPVPAPASVPEPAAVQVAVRAPEPKPAEPDPVPPSEADPEPAPAPVPEEKPEPSAQPEVVVRFPLKVTAEQVEEEERIKLEHELLLEPVYFQLRKGMRTGTRIRVPEARMKPSADGTPQVLMVSLWVTYVHAASAIVKASTASSGSSAPAPVQTMPATPPVQPKPAVVQTRKTVSFTPVTLNYGFQLCDEEKLKTGFRLNGADEIGNVVIAPENISVYRKSKAVGLAFGAIGSAIEGQGKLVKSVYPENVLSLEKQQINKRAYECRLHLRGNQLLKINVAGKKAEEALRALDLFLSQR